MNALGAHWRLLIAAFALGFLTHWALAPSSPAPRHHMTRIAEDGR